MARSATKPQLAAQLLAYIRQRNEAGVERTLAAGASVDGSSELDWRPIIAAAASGKVGMAELLIKRQANVDLGSLNDLRCSDGLEVLGKGVRALHVAINHYNVDVFRLLLKAGADPDSANGKGLTPLMLTCILEDSARGEQRAVMARELLEAGADPSLADFQGKTALGFAAARDQTNLIDILLQNAPTTLNRATPDGLTPLYAAAMSGKGKAVSHLLSAGARQPPASAEKDMCPLVAAVRENHQEVVRVLLTDRGMEAIDGPDVIPRAVGAAASSRKGSASIVRMLLCAEGHEREVHWARCRYKEDPVLHCAVSFGNISATRVLLAAGADETAENEDGRPAREVVGFNAPSLQRDPAKKGAIVRMLERGPAYRARSWAWPATARAYTAGHTCAAAATTAAPRACGAAAASSDDVCGSSFAGGSGDACAVAPPRGGDAGDACAVRKADGACANGDTCGGGASVDNGTDLPAARGGGSSAPLVVQIYRPKNRNAFLVTWLVARYADLGAVPRVEATGMVVLR
ncbi:unnamed protein product [Ectocarpus sp. 4 AP-2014]